MPSRRISARPCCVEQPVLALSRTLHRGLTAPIVDPPPRASSGRMCRWRREGAQCAAVGDCRLSRTAVGEPFHDHPAWKLTIYPRASAEWDQRRGRQATGRPHHGLCPPSLSGFAAGSGSMDSAGRGTGGSAIAPVTLARRARRGDADRHNSDPADRQALATRPGSDTTATSSQAKAAIQARDECALDVEKHAFRRR
jgi:hypothetical protein